jgi:beta-phosphoglucomutase-like phosphatase (HAD superfamily)
LHYHALQVALEPQGLAMDGGWYFERVGLTPAALFDEFEQQVGRFDRERVIREYTVAFQQGLSRLREVELIAGIAREWKGRVPMAVASNGRKMNVEATLRATGLLELFDYVVAAERCVVFEDSDERLEVARRAGMDGRDIRLVLTPAWKNGS